MVAGPGLRLVLVLSLGRLLVPATRMSIQSMPGFSSLEAGSEAVHHQHEGFSKAGSEAGHHQHEGEAESRATSLAGLVAGDLFAAMHVRAGGAESRAGSLDGAVAGKRTASPCDNRTASGNGLLLEGLQASASMMQGALARAPEMTASLVQRVKSSKATLSSLGSQHVKWGLAALGAVSVLAVFTFVKLSPIQEEDLGDEDEVYGATVSMHSSFRLGDSKQRMLDAEDHLDKSDDSDKSDD